MLIWLLNLVFDIVYWAFTLALWALPIFIVAKLLMPENKYLLLAAKYLDVAFTQVRTWLNRLPFKNSLGGFDLAPAVLWLVIVVARWLLLLLKGILL